LKGFQNVLVAVDGTRRSDATFRRALRIAQQSGAQLAVLAVEEPAPVFAAGVRWGPHNGHLRAAVDAAVTTAR